MCKKHHGNLLNIGSLNVRGLKKNKAEEKIADDVNKYKIAILGIQERHLQGTGIKDINTSDDKNTNYLIIR